MTAVRALALLSGGLDSMLATRMMVGMGFDVIALNFSSPFCTCTHKSAGCKNEAVRLSEELGIPVRVEFLGKEYLEVVRNPKYGYGKGINPCIDCRIMTFARAKEIMIEENCAFIFTGEVLGQRPMSQKLDRMNIIDRDAGLTGMVVRPLCAQLLEPTIPETEGLIDREKMLAIQGRSRKEQLRIAAEEYGITENLCSSGGCLLTDPHFAERMRDLLDHDDVTVKDSRLLRMGRHFRLTDRGKLIVGRNQEENERLERMARDEDFLFYPAVVRGPLALHQGELSRESMELAGRVTARYCDDKSGEPVEIAYRKKGEATAWKVAALPADEATIERMRV